jgi:hypothetical protein
MATCVSFNTFRQLHMKWPGAAPLTSAALRPCFQPVVDLAWAVLQAAAAAGHFAACSSSSSSCSGTSSESNFWETHVTGVVRVAVGMGRTLGAAVIEDRSLGQWLPHAQQFASDTLLKLLLVPVGVFVGELHKQQQQQGQVCVQPYHQQLLDELGVTPSEHQRATWAADISPYTVFYTCVAPAFAVNMRALVLQNSSSSGGISSSGSSSGTEQSGGAGTAARLSAVAAAAGLGISSRLWELMLLTVLEYTVLVSSTYVFCVAQCLTVSAVLHQIEREASSSRAASSELLQCLVLEVTPALLRSIRCATVAGSPTLADHAATSGSDDAEAALAELLDGSMRSLTLLSDSALHAGELLQARCSSVQQQACSDGSFGLSVFLRCHDFGTRCMLLFALWRCCVRQ